MLNQTSLSINAYYGSLTNFPPFDLYEGIEKYLLEDIPAILALSQTSHHYNVFTETTREKQVQLLNEKKIYAIDLKLCNYHNFLAYFGRHCRKIQIIQIRNLKDIEFEKVVTYFPSLKCLDVGSTEKQLTMRGLDYQTLTDENMDNLQKLKGLKELNIVNSAITNLEFLKNNSLIQSLCLQFIPFLEDISDLENSPALVKFSLAQCSLIKDLNIRLPKTLGELDLPESITNYKFMHIPLTNLEVLHLTNSSFAEGELLPSFSPNLRLLNLSQSKELNNFSFLQELTALKTLDVSRTKIDGSLPFQKLLKLNFLNLCNTPIADLNGLYNCTLLNDLYLRSCRNITNLDAIKEFARLKSLDVSSTSISSLEAIKECKLLKFLNISYCKKITSVAVLKTLPSLQSLTMSNIKPVDPASLLEFPSLSKITVTASFIPFEILRDLRAKNCQLVVEDQ